MRLTGRDASSLLAALLVALLALATPRVAIADEPAGSEEAVAEATGSVTADHDDSVDRPPNPRGHEGALEDAARSRAARGLPSWGVSGGVKTFYAGDGSVYASPALKVLDVSEWQGSSVDWLAAQRDGVDAAILRIGYGAGNEDAAFASNLSGCRRVGMPYGVYLYSYAYDESFARDEARSTADMLDRYGCSNMSLPISYDLEKR